VKLFAPPSNPRTIAVRRWKDVEISEASLTGDERSRWRTLVRSPIAYNAVVVLVRCDSVVPRRNRRTPNARRSVRGRRSRWTAVRAKGYGLVVAAIAIDTDVDARGAADAKRWLRESSAPGFHPWAA